MISRLLLTASAAVVAIGFVSGCSKRPQTVSVPEISATNQAGVANTAPAAMPTPATPQVLAPAADGSIDATLAQLTRELRRTMIGRKLSGSFEEFVAVRNLQVPPPPPGKKYAISKQWKVVLVDQ